MQALDVSFLRTKTQPYSNTTNLASNPFKNPSIKNRKTHNKRAGNVMMVTFSFTHSLTLYYYFTFSLPSILIFQAKNPNNESHILIFTHNILNLFRNNINSHLNSLIYLQYLINSWLINARFVLIDCSGVLIALYWWIEVESVMAGEIEEPLRFNFQVIRSDVVSLLRYVSSS